MFKIEHYYSILHNCPEEKEFNTTDGGISNLVELKNSIETGGNAFFGSYVSSNENHFANWVEGVFGDSHLASLMRSYNTAKENIELIENRLVFADLFIRFNAKRNEVVSNALDSHLLKEDLEFFDSSRNFQTLSDFDAAHALSFMSLRQQKPQELLELHTEPVEAKKEIHERAEDLKNEILKEQIIEVPSALAMMSNVPPSYKQPPEGVSEQQLIEHLVNQYEGKQKVEQKGNFFSRFFKK